MPKYQKSTELVVRELDDELVILNANTGYIHVLNSSGSLIWNLLDDLDTLDDIVTAMMQLYNNSNQAIIQTDVVEIIKDMVAQRIITES